MAQLELLGTSGCHLCEVAEKMVRQIAPVLGYSIEYIDIASEDALIEEYGIRIPVVRSDSRKELGWPFDQEQLIQWIESLS